MAKKIRTLKKYKKKTIRVDPLYKSLWFTKFINKFMLDGKKHVIEKSVYKVIFKMKHRFHHDPLRVMFLTVIRFRPLFGFISKRLGIQWKKIPVPLEPRRQIIIALKWLVSHTKTVPGRTFEDRLFRVFLDFYLNRKSALIKHRNNYFASIIEERVNTRFRWK